MMNAAIFDSYGFSKKLSQPYSEGFKPEFICNREELLDAWLNESPMPPLNCPSMFGFLAFLSRFYYYTYDDVYYATAFYIDCDIGCK